MKPETRNSTPENSMWLKLGKRAAGAAPEKAKDKHIPQVFPNFAETSPEIRISKTNPKPTPKP